MSRCSAAAACGRTRGRRVRRRRHARASRLRVAERHARRARRHRERRGRASRRGERPAPLRLARGSRPNTPALGRTRRSAAMGLDAAYFSGCSKPRAAATRARGGARAHVRAQAAAAFLWARPVEGARAALDETSRLGLRACCVSNSDGRAEHHLAALRHARGPGVRRRLPARGHRETGSPDLRHRARNGSGARRAQRCTSGDSAAWEAAAREAPALHFVLIDPSATMLRRTQLAVRQLDELPALPGFPLPLVPDRTGAPGARIPATS
jgi:hypothetical protein